MDIALDKVCGLILRAREIDVKEGITDPASGSNPIDDGWTDVLTSAPGDATEAEVRDMIAGLNEDERHDLIALVYIGRGDLEPEEWGAAVRSPASARTRAGSRPPTGCWASRTSPTSSTRASPRWGEAAPERPRDAGHARLAQRAHVFRNARRSARSPASSRPGNAIVVCGTTFSGSVMSGRGGPRSTGRAFPRTPAGPASIRSPAPPRSCGRRSRRGSGPGGSPSRSGRRSGRNSSTGTRARRAPGRRRPEPRLPPGRRRPPRARSALRALLRLSGADPISRSVPDSGNQTSPVRPRIWRTFAPFADIG